MPVHFIAQNIVQYILAISCGEGHVNQDIRRHSVESGPLPAVGDRGRGKGTAWHPPYARDGAADLQGGGRVTRFRFRRDLRGGGEIHY